jgi:hypothetical protein
MDTGSRRLRSNLAHRLLIQWLIVADTPSPENFYIRNPSFIRNKPAVLYCCVLSLGILASWPLVFSVIMPIQETRKSGKILENDFNVKINP